MPDDLNNEMDRMLRDYSRTRGQPPEREMHPATRRLLQGEVARVHGRTARNPSRFRGWLPYLALGGAFCVLIAAVLLVNRPDETQLARTEDALSVPQRGAESQQLNDLSRTIPMDPPALTSASDAIAEVVESPTPDKVQLGREFEERKEQPVLRTLKKEALSEGLAQNAERSLALKPAEPAATPQPSSRADAGREQAVSLAARAPAPAGPTEQPAPKAVAAVPSIELTNLGAAQRNRFVRATPAQTLPSTASTPAPVLASFQLEQLGQQVRLLDADGSVYTGIIQPDAMKQDSAETDSPAGSLAVQRNNSPTNLIQNAIVSYFQVTGANRTLGQQVVLRGQLLQKTNPSPVETTFSFEPARVAAQRRQGLPVPEPHRAIVGEAVIGGTNQLQIRAISPGP